MRNRASVFFRPHFSTRTIDAAYPGNCATAEMTRNRARTFGSAKHAGGFLEPTLPRQVVWALRNREAEQERDEGGERSDKEEEAPRAIELDDEEVPEPNGEKEPARPEEVEEHHVATTVLRREVL